MPMRVQGLIAKLRKMPLVRVSDERLEELRAAYALLSEPARAKVSDFDRERHASDAQHASLLTELQEHREHVYRECEGRTFVPNRAANWTEDYCDGRRTGQYSTNGPEEVECPRCNGVGYEAPYRAPSAPRMPTIHDADEEPF